MGSQISRLAAFAAQIGRNSDSCGSSGGSSRGIPASPGSRQLIIPAVVPAGCPVSYWETVRDQAAARSARLLASSGEAIFVYCLKDVEAVCDALSVSAEHDQ
eukprot:gene1706-2052_t